MVNDSTSATIKAILIDAVAAAALGIYIIGTVDTYMVLSKLILEKYLNNRFVAGEAKGREEGRAEGRAQVEEWQAWYERMMEAEARGEEFREPPPESSEKKS